MRARYEGRRNWVLSLGLLLCASLTSPSCRDRGQCDCSSRAFSASASAFYAVRRGRQPGIYEAWDVWEEQTKNFKGAESKKFKTREEAEAFLSQSGPAQQSGPKLRLPSFPESGPAQQSGPKLGLPSFPKGFALGAVSSKTELAAMPRLAFKGTVHVVNSANEHMIDWPRLESVEVLGFDTETKPKFTKGPLRHPTALVQLATRDECLIFQVLEPHGISKSCKRRLQLLLENPNIVKTGVGVEDDLRLLRDDYFSGMLRIPRVLDLRDIVRPYQQAVPQLAKLGLRALTALFLKGRLSKRQQLSNWAQENLTSAQVEYASTDAWVGWMLHDALRALLRDSEQWAPPGEIVFDEARGPFNHVDIR